MTHIELGMEIFRCSYLTGAFVLRSGALSNEYFDKYQFESRPELLSAIAEEMKELIYEPFDILGGLETGGIPLATAISLRTGVPAIFVRKKAKEYGTRLIAEGINFTGRKVVVVEDVVTSGGQVAISVEELRKAGADISLAVCVIDREAGGAEALAKNNIRLLPLFKMSELKKIAVAGI